MGRETARQPKAIRVDPVRLEKRMEALQRVKLAWYEFVILELEVELDFLRRAIRYLED
jgi:hypothetical protein